MSKKRTIKQEDKSKVSFDIKIKWTIKLSQFRSEDDSTSTWESKTFFYRANFLLHYYKSEDEENKNSGKQGPARIHCPLLDSIYLLTINCSLKVQSVTP